MLIPFDDHPLHQTSEPFAHVGQGHPDQYDRFWFNGYTEYVYFAVALGVYPNRGVIDAGFSVVHDGVQRSVFASGRIPLDRTATRIGPISVEIVEPMRINRIVVDAPEHGLTADLTMHARTAAFEEPRAARDAGTRRAWDATRATQFAQWTGRLSTGGTEIDLDGHTVHGTKDRSWGVRPVGVPPLRAPEPGEDQLFFLWAPLNFEDTCLHFMVHEDANGTPWARTAAVLPVIDKGYFHPEWAHGTWRGELVVGGEEAKTTELDVLRPDCVHLQQVVRATWGERTGIGVLEQLVFGPYAPAGLTEALDGVTGPAST